jgi:hypothetical protein
MLGIQAERLVSRSSLCKLIYRSSGRGRTDRYPTQWMLIVGNLCLFTFATVWACGYLSKGMYIVELMVSGAKYQLGWTMLPPLGAMPVPDEMWAEKYRRLNTPLTLMMNGELVCPHV